MTHNHWCPCNFIAVEHTIIVAFAVWALAGEDHGAPRNERRPGQAIEPGEKLGADPATRAQAVELVRNDGVADKAVGPVEDAIEAITKHAEEQLATEAAAQKKASLQSTLVLAVGILITAGIAVAGGLLLTGAIARPVAAMTNAMRRLAAGDNSVDVPAMGRKDEIGDMASAVVYFKDAAIEKIRPPVQHATCPVQIRFALHSSTLPAQRHAPPPPQPPQNLGARHRRPPVFQVLGERFGRVCGWG